MIQASVKQSKIQATASNANSTSQPTVQSKQFETQPGFLFLTNSFIDGAAVGEVVAEEEEEEGEDDEDDEDEDEAAGTPFDVDAPKLTALLGIVLLLLAAASFCDFWHRLPSLQELLSLYKWA